jgi:hypothetical protein
MGINLTSLSYIYYEVEASHSCWLSITEFKFFVDKPAEKSLLICSLTHFKLFVETNRKLVVKFICWIVLNLLLFILTCAFYTLLNRIVNFFIHIILTFKVLIVNLYNVTSRHRERIKIRDTDRNWEMNWNCILIQIVNQSDILLNIPRISDFLPII